MNVTFVLPGLRPRPVGGYRVHYEVASGLQRRGHNVVIVHKAGRRDQLRRRRAQVPWFAFPPGLRLLARAALTSRTAPGTNVYVFTNWRTALELPAVRNGAASAAIVYDYEFWVGAGDDRRRQKRDAFAQPGLALIAGDQGVGSKLETMNLEVVATLRPGIDLSVFRAETRPEARPPAVGVLLRPEPTKGTADALAALSRLRNTGPPVRAVAAGRWDCELPAWIERREADSDVALAAFYNELSVFVLPSRAEGFGLPAAEAMACGAAVVTTASGGVSEFAAHEENALVVPPGEPDALAGAVARLLGDDPLRARLARAGVQTASSMRWDDAVDHVEKVLTEAVEEARR